MAAMSSAARSSGPVAPGRSARSSRVGTRRRCQRLRAHRVGHRAQGAKRCIDQQCEALIGDDGINDASKRGRRGRSDGFEQLGLGQIVGYAFEVVASSARVSCSPVVTRDRSDWRSSDPA